MIRFAGLLAFFCGLSSLGLEILWVRLVGFAHHSVPQAFAFVLFAFLIGIAAGAHYGKRLCRDNHAPLQAAGMLLAVSGLYDILAPLVYALVVSVPALETVVLFILVAVASALKGLLFPLAHELGSRGATVLGRSVSNVYFANVLGATVGPILVGFVLLDRLGVQASFVLLGVLSLIVGLGLLAATFSGGAKPWRLGLAGVATLLCLVWVPADWVVQRIAASGRPAWEAVGNIIENRHGIIYTVTRPVLADSIYGGNVLDGDFNTSIVSNSNGIERMYALAALRPNAKRILVVGLSGGSWVEVLRHLPEVERIDVVELNPGYLDLIQRYPTVRGVLHDPKVHIHEADGRQWLKQHEGRYDLIVMNTTWHWRAYTSYLLSQEFLTVLSSRLAPGGMLAFNSTGSPDVMETAAQVFPHLFRYRNFIFAGHHDARSSLAQHAHLIRLVRPNCGSQGCGSEPKLDRAIERVAHWRTEDLEMVRAGAGRPLEVITEQNMLTEYKYGRGFMALEW
ncbi:membrane protein [Chitinimonas prasina]|uniref:Membrane protein n=1 Tax=Chitinimonas prasina TaxID=1434937 RepID=A0ABQ5YDU1_9NEIS|nr:fused MFS/spermidine synthase [Chitinimonas prasina]GLR11783.1 membrane protein [Chitinimonas prasina]